MKINPTPYIYGQIHLYILLFEQGIKDILYNSEEDFKLQEDNSSIHCCVPTSQQSASHIVDTQNRLSEGMNEYIKKIKYSASKTLLN